MGKMVWDLYRDPEGHTRGRPLFIPHDSYCQAFRIKYAPLPPIGTLGPIEHLNMSHVALK